MPRSRGSDSTAAPPHQRASPRAPLHLRATANTATSADSNATSVVGVHHNGRRSPKLEEHRRSPRSPLPEVGVCTTAQKKRATRVADLETRLSHAQEELRKLRDQLASAEAAKKDAQQELQETKKKKKKQGTTTTTVTAAAAGAAKKSNNGDGDDQACCDKECPLPSGESLQDKEKKQDDDKVGGEEGKEQQKQHEQEQDKDDEGGEEPKIVVAAAPDDAEERVEEPTAPVAVEAGCDEAAKQEALKEEPSNHNEAVDDVTPDDVPKQDEEQGRGGPNMEEQTNTSVEGVEQPMPAITAETSTTSIINNVFSVTAVTATTNTAEQQQQQEEEVVKPPSPAAAEEEMLELETRLWKKDKDLDLLRSENTSLKSQLTESEATAADLAAKVASLESSLEEQRRAADTRVSEMEAARAALELDVRRLRVQTEQWRKAADAAAAIISGEEFDGTAGALGGRKVAERCGSMDKYISGGGSGGAGLGFDAAAVLGSPLLMEGAEGDATAAGKRKGIRVFGDLWKKKGHTSGTNK